MKKLFIGLLLICSLRADLFDIVPGLSQAKSATNLFKFSSATDEKKLQLENLKKEKSNFESNAELTNHLQMQYDKTLKQINELKERIQSSKEEDVDFVRDLLVKANETSQILIDSQLLHGKILSSMESQIATLDNYLQDPEFKSLSVDKKTTYKFVDLEKISSLISTQEDNNKHLSEEKNSLEIDLENKKKALGDIEKSLKAGTRERTEFSDKAASEADVRKKSELLDYNLQLLRAKKDFLEIKIAEISNQLSLLNINIYLTNAKLNILHEDLEGIDKSLWVNESDIEETEKSLALKKQQYAESQAVLSTEIKQLIQRKEKLKDKFKLLAENAKFPAADLSLLDEWNIDFSKYDYKPEIYELGFYNDQILKLEQEINLKEAQRDLAKIKLGSDEVLSSIITSWYKISQRKIKTEADIASERLPYINYKNNTMRDLVAFKDKAVATSTQVNKLAKVSNNLKDKINKLEAHQELLVKDCRQPSKCLSAPVKDSLKSSFSALKKAESLINNQIELANKLIETYSAITSTISDTLKQTKAIVSKLDSIGGILHRSELAISWSSLKNIGPDLKQFVLDFKNMVYSFFTPHKLQIYYNRIIDTFTNFKSLFIFIFGLFFIFGIFAVLQILLLSILSRLSTKKTIISQASLIYLLLIGFANQNLKAIYFWFIAFVLIKFGIITDLGIRVLFYVLSIPYLIVLSNRFISYFIDFNRRYKHALVNKFFEPRLISVLWLFLSSTIIIFFFRDALTALTYSRSELPTLLLALYSIIFRALLIFLIGRDELLEIISKEKHWAWLRNIISVYYYPILISVVALMIISDPYIGGFSKLVSFMLWSIICTAFLVVGIWWAQVIIRKYSTYIFFSEEGDAEGAKERFSYAKTLYGLFIVVSFLLSTFIAIYIGAKIWGYTFGLEKFLDLWDYSFSIDKSTVTIGTLIKLLGFVFLGFIVSWAINKFIFQNIFDILLVDIGVQNTVSSISKYIIIIAVFLVGLLQVKLGSLIPVIVGAIILGLAFAVKGPVNDFVAYFILLVERPIKLGDFIKVTPEITGVVRKITARTVILRRKNSVTIVVPNSVITNSSFYNWNYTHGFFAFHDITLVVPFSCNPEVVKDILFEVLDANANVLKSPKPIIRLDDFVDNGYLFMVRGYLSSFNVINQWQIASNVRFEIIKALKKQNISIASPIRNIVIQQPHIETNDSGTEGI